MNEWLFTIIRCPITSQALRLADDELVAAMKQRQQSSELISHTGIPIEDAFDAGLVNDSQTYFYRVQDSIPSLLPDEAVKIGVRSH